MYVIFLQAARNKLMGNKETLNREVIEVAGKKVIETDGRTHVREIPGRMEQQFFLLLIEQISNQGGKVAYEPHSFRIYYRNGETETTTPDFLIEMPDGSRSYIEITAGELNGKDPKKRQRRIMSHFPDIEYRILYKDDLRRIQKANPQYSFWHSKRVRR